MTRAVTILFLSKTRTIKRGHPSRGQDKLYVRPYDWLMKEIHGKSDPGHTASCLTASPVIYRYVLPIQTVGASTS